MRCVQCDWDVCDDCMVASPGQGAAMLALGDEQLATEHDAVVQELLQVVWGLGFGVSGLWFATLTLDADAAHAGPG